MRHAPPPYPHMLTPLLLTGWASTCAGFDLSSRRIPNALTLGAIGIGAVWLTLSGTALLGAAWLPTCVVAVGALACGAGAFAAGWVGAGDVKLWVAMALLAGPAPFAAAMSIGSVLAGLSALLMLRAGAAAPLLAGALEGVGLRGFTAGARTRIPLAAPYGLGFAAACWGVV